MYIFYKLLKSSNTQYISDLEDELREFQEERKNANIEVKEVLKAEKMNTKKVYPMHSIITFLKNKYLKLKNKVTELTKENEHLKSKVSAAPKAAVKAAVKDEEQLREENEQDKIVSLFDCDDDEQPAAPKEDVAGQEDEIEVNEDEWKEFTKQAEKQKEAEQKQNNYYYPHL